MRRQKADKTSVYYELGMRLGCSFIILAFIPIRYIYTLLMRVQITQVSNKTQS